MNFEVVGDITAIETIAVGSAIYDLPRLKRLYGKGRWRKMKGQAPERPSPAGRTALVRGPWSRKEGTEAKALS